MGGTTPKPVVTTKPAVSTGNFSWTKVANKHCASSSHPKSYPSLKEAAVDCVKLGSACIGIYDGGCNNVGEFRLCKSGNSFVYSGISCVYTPNDAKTKSKGTTRKGTTPKPVVTTKPAVS